MHDAAYDPAIVNPRHAAGIVRQQGPKPRPLSIIQKESIQHLPAPAVRELESELRRFGNLEASVRSRDADAAIRRGGDLIEAGLN